jgi:hypothetical protein
MIILSFRFEISNSFDFGLTSLNSETIAGFRRVDRISARSYLIGPALLLAYLISNYA